MLAKTIFFLFAFFTRLPAIVAMNTPPEYAVKIARLIFTAYLDSNQENCAKDIINKLSKLFKDPTLKSLSCHQVKDALVPMLANKVYTVSLINNQQRYIQYNDPGPQCLKYTYYDGTTEIVGAKIVNNRKIIVVAKPDSPWHSFSFVELIKRYQLIDHLHTTGFPYPFLE